MIDWVSTGDPHLAELLRAHPKVADVRPGVGPGAEFQQGAWHRKVEVGSLSVPLRGLVELMDNNPMVCADLMSAPDAASTLALIGLGPLAWAGLILESPTALFSFSVNDETSVANYLSTAGWNDGVTVHVEQQELGSVIAATTMAVIRTPSDWSEIDELYEERYGKAFFVRLDEESEWRPELVQGKPWAAYRLRCSPGEDTSLLTAQVLADRNGKAGGAQVLHAMNVMAGFEESLGIA